jgi:hypothetical protein
VVGQRADEQLSFMIERNFVGVASGTEHRDDHAHDRDHNDDADRHHDAQAHVAPADGVRAAVHSG